MFATLLIAILTASQADPASEPGPDQVVMLDDYAPCGLTSLYVVCKFRAVSVGWERIKELVGPVAPDGSDSFADLARAATALGMRPMGLQVSRQALKDLPMPAIVQVHDPRDRQKPAHLMVLLRTEPDGVVVLDPPYPAYFLPEQHFAAIWTGNVLVFARDESEAEQLRSEASTGEVTRLLLWVGVGLGAVAVLGLFFRRWGSVVCHGVGKGFASAGPRFRPVLVTALCLGAVGSAVGYWLLLSGQSRATAAQCVFDSPVIELGELAPGSLKYTIPIRNGGTVPLKISKVLSTCTCAVVKAPEEIEPGGSTVLEVDLNIPPGPRGARITIESNDPEGAKTVALSWHGKAAPKLLPYKVEDRAVSLGRPYERTIKVIYPGGKFALLPVLERCDCDSPLVEVRPGKNEPMATRFARSGLLTQVLGEQELHVRVVPPEKAGYFSARCKLHLKLGETATTLNLPIRLEFQAGELKPETRGVVFSAARADQLLGQERSIRVEETAADDQITVAEVPDWLECEVIRQPGECSTLRIRVVKQPPQPLTQHTLQLRKGQGPGVPTPLTVRTFVSTR